MGSFEDFLDNSWKSFRQQLLQAHAAQLTAKAKAQLVLPLPSRQEPHCHRARDTEMLLAVRPRSPEEESPARAQAPEPDVVKNHDPGEDPEGLPVQSLNSTGSSQGKRRSRRPSVHDYEDQKTAFAAVQKRESKRPSVAETELVLSLQEAATLAQEEKMAEDSPFIDKEAQSRLQVRLGALDTGKMISGAELQDTTQALGLTSYTEEDMNLMLNTLADHINLSFYQAARQLSPSLELGVRLSRGRSSLWNNVPSNGTPTWQWPKQEPRRRISQMGRGSIHLTETTRKWNVVPFRALVEAFQLDDQELSNKVFPYPPMMMQFQAVKEILLAGDTNRLVAELTFVRINDLAAPPERLDVLAYLDPLVILLILCNGIMIGVQSDPQNSDWPGWWWIELVFALLLCMELALRLFVSGCRKHFRGPERMWNLFDLILICAAITDLMLEFVYEEDSTVAIATLLRFARMVRITRIMKVFRLHWMKELRLMLKGLIGGIRTLITALFLLVAVLYVIAGLATYTLGRSVPEEFRPLFYNLPISMFTTFRCLAGQQCDTDTGAPLPSMLASEFGVPFVLGYVISYMLVTMGISNVILAVYVDITMRAAKESEANTADQHARESLRIARTARELLKKFAAAERVYSKGRETMTGASSLDLTPASAHFTDQVMHGQLEITKELFLLVIQNSDVQRLMDDLDLPPDRANLFEVIDADGSGTLRVAELVQGLLKVRGELKKSDVVATTLAIQSLQQLVAETREQQKVFEARVLRVLADLSS